MGISMIKEKKKSDQRSTHSCHGLGNNEFQNVCKSSLNNRRHKDANFVVILSR